MSNDTKTLQEASDAVARWSASEHIESEARELCMFYGSTATDIAPRSDVLAKPLTFAEAAELERKAAMFEDIARAIREVLAKFPPQ